MERYIVKGGTPLVGRVEISGAKNAALGIISAAILTEEAVTIDNIPDVNDIHILLRAIKAMGAVVKTVNPHCVIINASTISTLRVDYEYVKQIRGSYYLLGALLGRFKEAEVALPGGCDIGSRPIDQHIKGFRAMGAEVDIVGGFIKAKADVLSGSEIYLDMASVGATINLMLAAVLAEGKTIIENAAKEPHIVDVANFLNSMGANIKGAGTDIIRVRGVERLHKTEYTVIPDQIEAGTFMFAAAATQGDVTITNVIPKHLEATTSKLIEMGCRVKEYDDYIRVYCQGRLKSTKIKTLPYPGFPTDMQPQMAVTLALSHGTSIVTETIYENRFKYVDEMMRMGANMRVEGNSVIIEGVPRLSGCILSSPDLRAGAALVIAALCAEGISVIEDIKYIQRGYERFDEKLKGLGAQIERVDNDRDLQKTRFSLNVV